MEKKEWFYEWQTPVEFFNSADAIADDLGAERFFNQAGLSWLREAWTVGRFGILTGAKRCKLSKNDPPDAQIEIGSKNFYVEVTEALDPERQRGKEYKQRQFNGMIGQPLMDRHAEQFHLWVESAVEKKILKSEFFPVDTIILIHLSGHIWFLHDNDKISFEEQVHNRVFSKNYNFPNNIIGLVVLKGDRVYVQPGLLEKEIYSPFEN